MPTLANCYRCQCVVDTYSAWFGNQGYLCDTCEAELVCPECTQLIAACDCDEPPAEVIERLTRERDEALEYAVTRISNIGQMFALHRAENIERDLVYLLSKKK